MALGVDWVITCAGRPSMNSVVAVVVREGVGSCPVAVDTLYSESCPRGAYLSVKAKL